MSLHPAVLDALLEAGATAEMIVAAVKAEAMLETDRVEHRRAKDRERQRRHRERSASTGGHNMSRTVTATPRDTVSPKERKQTPSGTDLPNEAIASLPIRQPVSEATGIWNENAAEAGWPQIKTMSANRQKLLSARLREHGLDGWRAAIAKARASPYLAGPDPPSWFTFPWLIKAENFLKTIEGNYDRRHSDSNNKSLTAIALERIGALQH